MHNLKSLAMIPFYAFVFLSTASGGTSKTDSQCLNGLKYLQWGENIHLNCFFSSADTGMIAWFKQTPGEKPLLIVSAFGNLQIKYHNDFDKSGRFNSARTKDAFNLRISNAEPSDSATYYCAFAYYTEATLLDCTVLVLKGSSSSLSAVLQPPVSDAVELGGDTTLQCSILTDVSAGDHSVYWFRHGSGESHPGIIYTHGNRSDECKKSSETDSPTQSCVYKLPKRNLSLSDAGTYYCAVLICGEIIFGNGTKLDFEEKCALDPTIVVLVVSNIIALSVALFMCRKHSSHHKDAAEAHAYQPACGEASYFAADTFIRDEPQQKTEDVNSKVIYYQQN
ncbi:T cell receptor alpha chain MC.7.G5-like [Pygocentrus nattereri]|uniref:T cell receptor alpha chain MC.7.G5-like n=1 Tax=Pygocentrus nattereri TaxID=42514 RepID=UPI0018910F81|nr:T cell receptor alpha chain MC.7.G5-like [Pygocentrus nattereri]